MKDNPQYRTYEKLKKLITIEHTQSHDEVTQMNNKDKVT